MKANDTKVGDYKRFSIPNKGFVVVQLAKVNKEGLMTPENASATALTKIRNAKKAKMIRENITASNVADFAKNQKQSKRTACGS